MKTGHVSSAPSIRKHKAQKGKCVDQISALIRKFWSKMVLVTAVHHLKYLKLIVKCACFLHVEIGKRSGSREPVKTAHHLNASKAMGKFALRISAMASNFLKKTVRALNAPNTKDAKEMGSSVDRTSVPVAP